MLMAHFEKITLISINAVSTNTVSTNVNLIIQYLKKIHINITLNSYDVCSLKEVSHMLTMAQFESITLISTNAISANTISTNANHS